MGLHRLKTNKGENSRKNNFKYKRLKIYSSQIIYTVILISKSWQKGEEV